MIASHKINWAGIIAEDCPGQDISSCCLVGLTQIAVIYSKDTGVFYCGPCLHELVQVVDTTIIAEQLVPDGAAIQPGMPLIRLSGPVASILKLERSLLNLIQRLSGIASITRRCVDALGNPDIAIVDTRKTTPLLRILEKAAVVAGGGQNHRFGLSDMILLKENHIMMMQHAPLHTQLTALKHQYPGYTLEIEISDPDTLYHWDLSAADIIMFDNFSFPDMQTASVYCNDRYPTTQLELSGNITVETVHQYGELPIDRIAIGQLTHSVRALDMSLLLTHE